MNALMSSLLAVLEARHDDAVCLMEEANANREPEVLVYFARHYSRMKQADRAVKALRIAAESGFVCAPDTLNSDPWLNAVRKHPEFGAILSTAERLVHDARSSIVSRSGVPR
jgi:hypothetical protein